MESEARLRAPEQGGCQVEDGAGGAGEAGGPARRESRVRADLHGEACQTEPYLVPQALQGLILWMTRIQPGRHYSNQPARVGASGRRGCCVCCAVNTLPSDFKFPLGFRASRHL